MKNFLKFFKIPDKLISSEEILSVVDLSPRKICFSSCHLHALKRKTYENAIGSFTVPFEDTIKPIFESVTKLSLFHNSKYGNFWYSIFSENDYKIIEEFTKEYSSIVFLRDCLDLSIALCENFDEDERTALGQLEYEAKYQKNEKSLKELIGICSKWIMKLPFYKDADYICAIPPSKNGVENLPRKIANGLTEFELKNISDSVSWSKDKEELKGVDYSKKLKLLESTGLNINIDLEGKVVILLDDLYQSGITMQYVAMKLKDSGVSKVLGLAIVKSRSNTDNV